MYHCELIRLLASVQLEGTNQTLSLYYSIQKLPEHNTNSVQWRMSVFGVAIVRHDHDSPCPVNLDIDDCCMANSSCL